MSMFFSTSGPTSTGTHCVGCGGARLSPIDSYKHTWYTCLDCGTVTRKPKKVYPAARVPGLARVLPPGARRFFLGEGEVPDRQSELYDYYRDSAKRGDNGTKWAGEYEVLEAELAALGVKINAPRTLDLSGGPGFFAQNLKKHGSDVVLTEFSPFAAKAMEDVLDVRSVAYDYNVDTLKDALPEDKKQFDVVFSRYSVNFCVDLKRFAHDVRDVVAPGGHLYLTTVLPSLGTTVRWGYFNYPYRALYTKKYVRDLFSSVGFKLVGEVPSEQKTYKWHRQYDLRLHALVLPYLTKALMVDRARRLLDRSPPDFIAALEQRHCEDVYQLV